MKFHTITAFSSFIDLPIRSIHYRFFHGIASRGGEFPTAGDYRVTHDVDLPLRLHKNVYKIAGLFCPESELVVSSQVADALEAIVPLTKTSVSFAVLYSFPYEPGKLSYGFETYDQEMRFIDEQQDDPALHQEIGAYYHLATPPLYRVREQFAGSPKAPLNCGSVRFPEMIEIPVGREVFDACPIYTLGSTKVMAGDVFDALEPAIDWNYFTHSHGTIPD